MFPLALLGSLGGAGTALGGLAGLFGNKNKNNPANDAMKYLNQIPGQTGQYFQPWINKGNVASDKLSNQYNKMTTNPGDLYASLGKGYQQSPGYQFKLNQALDAGANASARGGMLGTPQDQQYAQQTAHDISNQDYEDYMNHILGIYGSGQQGLQGQQTIGANMSQDYGNSLANLLGQQAQYAFMGKQGQNQANQANWGNLFSGLGAMGTGYASGDMMQQMLQKYLNGGS